MSTSGRAAGGPPTGPAGGDIAGTGTSTYPNPTLTAIGAATGPIGSSSLVPVVTIDTKGRVTALTSTAAGGAGIQSATVTLNTAAVKALFTTPTTVVAAPGAGKLLIPILGVAQLAPTAATLGNPPVTQTFHYGSVVTVASRACGPVAPDIVAGNSTAAASIALYPNATGVATSDANAPYVNIAAVNLPIKFGAESAGAGVIDIGPIVTATIDDGGLGYAVGDTGTIDTDVFGPGATYIVTTVTPVTGIVTGFTVTNPGDGYTTLDNPLGTATGGAQPGAGIGLDVNVTAVTAFAANLHVTLYYATLTLT